MKITPSVIEEFRSALPPGSVLSDVKPFSQDFGATDVQVPAAVVMVRTEADVSAALRVATRTSTPVTIRGAGHSCGGQTLSDGGVVLLNFSEQGCDLEVREDGLVDVSARSPWGAVERRLNQHELAVPVLPAYLDLTVGGTLSVGGYGYLSLRRGAQVDAVEALRIVTSAGDALWCDRQNHPDLFRYSLAGLGQLGVIERARFYPVSRPEAVHVVTFGIPSTSALVELIAELASSPELIAGFGAYGHATGGFNVEVEVHAPDKAAAANAIAKLTAARASRRSVDIALHAELPFHLHAGNATLLATCPAHRPVWCDYVLPLSSVETFVTSITRHIVQTGAASRLKSIYLLGIQPCGPERALPLAAHHIPTESGLLAGVGMYFMVPPGDELGLSLAKAAHRLALEFCIDCGGRPYRYGVGQLSQGQREHAYGQAFSEAKALKAHYDPQGLLNPSAG